MRLGDIKWDSLWLWVLSVGVCILVCSRELNMTLLSLSLSLFLPLFLLPSLPSLLPLSFPSVFSTPSLCLSLCLSVSLPLYFPLVTSEENYVWVWLCSVQGEFEEVSRALGVLADSVPNRAQWWRQKETAVSCLHAGTCREGLWGSKEAINVLFLPDNHIFIFLCSGRFFLVDIPSVWSVWAHLFIGALIAMLLWITLSSSAWDLPYTLSAQCVVSRPHHETLTMLTRLHPLGKARLPLK